MRRAALLCATLALLGLALSLHHPTRCKTWEDGSQSCSDGTVRHVPH